MASSWTVSGMVLLVVAAGLVVSSSAKEQDLNDCIPYTFNAAVGCQFVITEAAAPDKDCCLGLKDMKEKFDFCFCRFIRDQGNTSSGWYTPNYEHMLQAPDVCGIPNGLSDCPAILDLPADSPDAVLFKTQKPAVLIKSASPSSSPSLDTKPTFSSSSFPFALPPEAAFSMSGGVVAHILSLGTVVSSMAVAAWILA
ncbi:YLS3 protein [Nymphaea thermarum]|nr:YLS3 protein [Nymphaea thermarum]